MSVAEPKQAGLPARLALLVRRYRALMVLQATGGMAAADLDRELVDCGRKIQRLSRGSRIPIPRDLRSALKRNPGAPKREGRHPSKLSANILLPSLSLDRYLGLSDEEKDRFHIQVYQENEAGIARELNERRAEWILVVGGEVRRCSRTLDDYPSAKEVMDLAEREREIPFIFVRSPIIEETV